MAKGYWIARVDVHDMEAYKLYVAANAVAFNKFNARFLVRGGQFTAKEGSSRSRNVVLEFDSYQTALDCYHSDEYSEALKLRLNDSDSEGELVIVEGYDP